MRRRITLSLLLCTLVLIGSCIARAADDPWEKTVNIDASEITLSQAVEALMKNSRLNYAVEPSIGSVPLSHVAYKDVPMRTAFEGILKQAGAVYREDGGVVVIAPAAGNESPWAKPVNLEVKDMPLSQVLDSLLKDASVSYTISPEITGIKVNAVLKNVNLDMAIRQVAKAAGIIYRVDKNTYLFAPRPCETPGPPVLSSLSDDGDTRRIALEYVDPSDVIPMLQLGGKVQVVGSGSSFVIIRGSDEAIEKALSTIRMLDTPDALPQAIRVTVTEKVTLRPQGKEPRTYEWSTESVGVAGQPMPLDIFSCATHVKKTVNDAKGVKTPQLLLGDQGQVNMQVTPSVSPDGTVSLFGNGFMKVVVAWTTLTKQFEVGIAIAPKQAAVIAAGSSPLNGGKIEFEVSATATVEANRLQRRPGGPEVQRFNQGGNVPGQPVPRGPAQGPAVQPPASKGW